jgi:hypothetical protein
MAKSNILSYCFNRGIISPLALARFDLKRLALSAQIMTNWMCRTLGSMMLRPGFAFVDSTYNNLKAVHIPFIFSISDTAQVELTNNLMRVRVNEQIITRLAVGTAITNGDFNTNLTGWTQADDAGGLSQWAAGGFMSLNGNNTARGVRYQTVTVASGDQGVEHALRIVVAKGYVTLRVGTAAGDDSYISNTTLAPGIHSLALTPTGNFVVQVSSATVYTTLINSINIEAAGAMTITTPWPTAMLNYLRWDQSADVVFIASDGTIQQQRIERRSKHSWSLVAYLTDDGPFINQNLDASIILSASALNGDITLTSNRPFFKSGHVGTVFSLQSQNGSSVTDTVAGNQQFSDPIEVTGVSTNGGRNLTINITGSWSGTIVLQYSVGAPGAWVDSGQSWTGNQSNVIYNDGFDNQDIFYRIGFENSYSSGSAQVVLSFSVASTVAGIVRIDSFNSNTSVNAHVLKPLSGLTSLPGVAASGSITFSAKPSNGDTIAVNGITWTFVTMGATGNQTNIGVNLSATMTQLATDLGASGSGALTVASYTSTPTALVITYGVVGASGNAYTMASGTLNSVPSGPTLAGGVGATTGVGTTLWAQGLWSGIKGYPTAVCFYEGRLWWFGQDYIAGSVSDAYASYDQTVIGDSGPIIRTIAQGPVSIINWALGLQRLLVGCDGTENSVRSDSLDTPLTPTNFNIKSPSTRGSAAVAAVKIDTNGVYVQRGDPDGGNVSGTRLIQIAYQGTYAIIDYTTSDLSEFAPELVATGIIRIAVQRKIDTRIHCVLVDGTVAVLVYDPVENEKGWLLVTTDGAIEDVFVMPGGVEDKVYYVVNRTINGNPVRYLERWALESECIGGSISKNSDSHTVIVNGSPSTSVSVPHLAGKVVTIWADGKDIGTQADGTQAYTLDSSGNTTLAVAATNVVVGLYYSGQFQSVKLTQTVQSGTTIGHVKNIDHVGVILANTHYQGLQYGKDFSTLENLPLVEKGAITPADTIWSAYDNEPFEFDGEWDTDSRLCLQAASPRPCTILAAVIGVHSNEK